MRLQFCTPVLVIMGVSVASAQVASHAPTTVQTRLSDMGAASPSLQVSDKPVARVNTTVLTDRDLLREMYTIFPYAQQHNGFPKELEPEIRRGALEMIIFEELVYQEAKRRYRGLQWMGSFHASHSGFTHLEGYSSRSEGFSTNVIFRRFTVSGQYSQSAGTSILTSIGLIELPPGIPPPLLDQLILYDAKSYGGGASITPFRRCTVGANYNKARSATAGPAISSGFQSTIFNARLQYRLRKLNVEGNFTKFQQSISTGALPAVINWYYVRFSRWFNVF